MTSCPRCGATASGKFCINCGAPLAETRCPRCDTVVTPGASFCHNCAAPLSRATRTAIQPAWILVGVLVVVLVIVATIRLGPSTTLPPTGPMARALPAPAPMPVTPRAEADEYFNRTMVAHERGDTAGVNFYGPVALSAYAALGVVDNDMRLHVGLIHITMGNTEAALAQSDSLDRAVPGHLYATVLRYRAYRLLGDTTRLPDMYTRFLEYYECEIAAGRPEYREHRRMLEAFLMEARQATGG